MTSSYDDNCCHCAAPFPTAGGAVLGLWLSCIAALGSTMWGVSSCRFLYIDFISDRGSDFNNIFLDPTADTAPTEQRIGAGLYTWLKAFEADLDWSEGSCAGYSEAVLDKVSDYPFEVARIFSVLAVLMGWAIIFWIIFLSCFSMGRFQIWVMRVLCGMEIIFCGLTFVIFQSYLCKSLVSDQGFDSECTLDQGGLVIIASCILWCVACVIASLYIKPRALDVVIVDGRIASAFEERLASRKQYGIFGPESTKGTGYRGHRYGHGAAQQQRQEQQQQHYDENEEYEQEYAYDDRTNTREEVKPKITKQSKRRKPVVQQHSEEEEVEQPQPSAASPISIQGVSQMDGNVELELG
eukprot:CAMPEP_0198113890 /NCGR_PEP_ID=MMETSP1442-20131203/5440_1 /TAXON_ID= /ORGANISM="Craspedostauros australis, Strain CCMP3328" /LENGTH=352 /DNA_ID=CAMNT_0043771089 /DNA_START=413 /DNA_END=1470 /DNA_ORIENTATION=-